MKWATLTSCGLTSPFKCSGPGATVTIDLSNPKQSYTTWDQIEGRITVTVDEETTFDTMSITFEGSSRVALLRPITLNREIKASHTFLKLQQPIDKTEYPTARTLVPGRSYTYPFTFVIPEELPIGSCIHDGDIHNRDEGAVPQRHAELPPTMCLENLSQELCRISYLIRAIVTRQESTIATSTRNIRFTPTLPDNIQSHLLYRYSTEQEVKCDRKLAQGRLAIVAAAPQVAPHTYLKDSSPTDMDARVSVQLRFDPVGEAQPPQLRTLYSTLKASTVFHARLDAKQLAVGSVALDSRYRGAHVKTMSLPSVDVSSTRWVKHQCTHYPECIGSQHSAEPTIPPSCAGGTYYTASIDMPIVLPESSDLLPTFYSCLVSRVHLLNLSLSYRMLGTRRRRALKLQVPVELGRSCDQSTINGLRLSHLGPPPSYSGQESQGTTQDTPQRILPFRQNQAGGLPGCSEGISWIVHWHQGSRTSSLIQGSPSLLTRRQVVDKNDALS